MSNFSADECKQKLYMTIEFDISERQYYKELIEYLYINSNPNWVEFEVETTMLDRTEVVRVTFNPKYYELDRIQEILRNAVGGEKE